MRFPRRALRFVWLLLALAGCSRPPTAITLATTTSTRDSGLLDELAPMFEQQTGVTLKVVAVGSGQALALGRRGDADVLLTHAPDAEDAFVAAGYGVHRQAVMHNDFVLVGPPADPARTRQARSVAEAFAKIAGSGAAFVSRADESGTHMKEEQVWREAGVEPVGAWYLQAGAGMAPALRLAAEKGAYTLSDRGTFLALREGLDLVVLGDGDALLLNHYSVIVVNHDKPNPARRQAAELFASFLVLPATQARIAAYGAAKYGEPLFFPTAPPRQEPGEKAAPTRAKD